MNLASSWNLDAISPEVLPPMEARGRLRVLCLIMKFTGLRSFGLEMERYLATRDDVEAVHVTFDPAIAFKAMALGVPLLGRFDLDSVRGVLLWKLQLSRWLRRGGPLDLRRFDAVLCTSQYMAMAPVAVRGEGGPRVLAYMDATGMNNRRLGWSEDVGDRLLVRLERRLLARCDLVACASRWARDSCVADYGLDPARVLLVPPTAAVVEPIPRAPGPTRIIFIGNSFERKGGARLLAWHQERWADTIELHIVSSRVTPDRARRGVVWHGGVERQRLITELVPSMDAFVMPTTLDQSCWPAVEAQMAGVPCVVSRTGGIDDLVEHGVTGFLHEADDDRGFIASIERLRDDAGLRASMGHAARERAMRLYTREAVFGPVIDALRSRASVITEPKPLPAHAGALT